MSALEGPDPDVANPVQPHQDDKAKEALAEAERALSHVEDPKDRVNYDKIDKELAQYVSDGQVVVSKEESDRLRRLIDRRVLAIMIVTYFVQAIDKGTMSFAAIMGIRKDLALEEGQKFSWLTTCIYITILFVEYPQVRASGAELGAGERC